MKKIIIILITIFATITKVYAIEKVSYSIGRIYKSLCINGNIKYKDVPYVKLDMKESFYLKPLDTLNTNLKTYEYDDLDNYKLPDDLKDYFFAFLDFKKIDSEYYLILTQRLIWEYLYPELDIKFCNYQGKIIDFHDDEYNQIKKKVASIAKGPDFFNNDNYLIQDKEYTFEFEYLDNFDLISKPNDLNVKIENSKLIVSGKNGKYQLFFKKKPITEKLYIKQQIITDNNNSIFSFKNFNDKEYIMNIIIDSANLNVLILDDNDKALTNKCILLNEKNYCTNENGMININGLFKGKYNILFEETEEYEKISQDIELNNDSMIKLKLIHKNKEIKDNNDQNINDNLNNENNDDNQEIGLVPIKNVENNNEDYLIFKDTLSINKFYIAIMVFIFLTAVAFCIKRLKR